MKGKGTYFTPDKTTKDFTSLKTEKKKKQLLDKYVRVNTTTNKTND